MDPGADAEGRDRFIELAARTDAAFTDVDIRVVPLDVGGDFACVEWVVDATHSGPLAMEGRDDAPPTGARLRVHGITVAEFDGDRICSIREYWNELPLLLELGGLDPA